MSIARGLSGTGFADASAWACDVAAHSPAARDLFDRAAAVLGLRSARAAARRPRRAPARDAV